jgi:hypothetical protein
MTEIVIASVPDREELVAEIWDGDIMLAELSQDGGELVLRIYPKPTGEPWSFEMEELLQTLSRARSQLLGDSMH